MITQQEFEQFAQTCSVIPLVETMLADLHTPVSIYLALRSDTAPSFLLESVEPDERIGRFSFVGTDPLFLIRAKGDVIEIESCERREQRRGKVLDVLNEYSHQYQNVTAQKQNGFAGGFLGYYGYDRIQEIERIPVHPPSEGDVPDAMFGLFNSVVKFDHLRQLLTVINNVIVTKDRPLDEQYYEGKIKLETILAQLGNPPAVNSDFQCDCASVQNNADADTYCASVRKAKEYIREGDIFQVVLSRRVCVPYSGDPFPVYRALRIINPSPYLFYLDFRTYNLLALHRKCWCVCRIVLYR